jgi:SAM-dependent methyltransferase
MPRLVTREVRDSEDIRTFFDTLAATYRESHGDARRLLDYRLRLIRGLLGDVGRGCLVEIGCGTGLHLFPLAGEFDILIGTDLAPAMVAAAEKMRMHHPRRDRILLAVDAAERLSSVPDGAADAVLCVGAFEHMTDKPAVLATVRRVLKPGGAFVCLTGNGEFIWHTRLAPRLGWATRHLSTDRLLTRAEWLVLLDAAGLTLKTSGCWRFVPAGDMPRAAAILMRMLDPFGAALKLHVLRGGLYVKAVRAAPRAASMSIW